MDDTEYWFPNSIAKDGSLVGVPTPFRFSQQPPQATSAILATGKAATGTTLGSLPAAPVQVMNARLSQQVSISSVTLRGVQSWPLYSPKMLQVFAQSQFVLLADYPLWPTWHPPISAVVKVCTSIQFLQVSSQKFILVTPSRNLMFSVSHLN